MQARSAVDPLALWRGIDDAVGREAARAPATMASPPVAAEAKRAKPARPVPPAQRAAQVLEPA